MYVHSVSPLFLYTDVAIRLRWIEYQSFSRCKHSRSGDLTFPLLSISTMYHNFIDTSFRQKEIFEIAASRLNLMVELEIWRFEMTLLNWIYKFIETKVFSYSRLTLSSAERNEHVTFQSTEMISPLWLHMMSWPVLLPAFILRRYKRVEQLLHWTPVIRSNDGDSLHPHRVLTGGISRRLSCLHQNKSYHWKKLSGSHFKRKQEMLVQATVNLYILRISFHLW